MQQMKILTKRLFVPLILFPPSCSLFFFSQNSTLGNPYLWRTKIRSLCVSRQAYLIISTPPLIPSHISIHISLSPPLIATKYTPHTSTLALILYIKEKDHFICTTPTWFLFSRYFHRFNNKKIIFLSFFYSILQCDR